MATIPPNGPVGGAQATERGPKRRPRGASFTPERAKLVAIEREARRREARRLAAERGDQTERAQEVRDIVVGLGAPRMSDPRVELPALSLTDLVSRNGVLVYTGQVEPHSASRTRENFGPAVPTAPPSARAGSRPRPADDQARPGEVLDPSRDAAKVKPEVESTIAGQIWERAEQDQRDRDAQAAEQESQQIARARVAREHLRQAIASPHLAAHMLPWSPVVPRVAGTCSGCGLTLSADRRAGHAVEASTKHAKPRERCIEWALGITL